jgi:hypothetical protein
LDTVPYVDMQIGERVAGCALVLISLAGTTSCGLVRNTAVDHTRLDGSVPPNLQRDATPEVWTPQLSLPSDASSPVLSRCPADPQAATGTACDTPSDHCSYGYCSWFCDCITAEDGTLVWNCTTYLC